jgi:peptidyl-tRNA hydrolase
MQSDETAEHWRDRWSREVAAKVSLEIEVARLQQELVDTREIVDEMIRQAHSRDMR